MKEIRGRAFTAAFLLLLSWAGTASADGGVLPCYYYGRGDGKLGAPTAFAESWLRPAWLPAEVRNDYMGAAVRGYAPGTLLEVVVMGVPGWAGEEHGHLVGRRVRVRVADRPGGEYVDLWPLAFARLTGGHFEVGRLDVWVRLVRSGRRRRWR